jgi:hypothetical protein
MEDSLLFTPPRMPFADSPSRNARIRAYCERVQAMQILGLVIHKTCAPRIKAKNKIGAIIRMRHTQDLYSLLRHAFRRAEASAPYILASAFLRQQTRPLYATVIQSYRQEIEDDELMWKEMQYSDYGTDCDDEELDESLHLMRTDLHTTKKRERKDREYLQAKRNKVGFAQFAKGYEVDTDSKFIGKEPTRNAEYLYPSDTDTGSEPDSDSDDDEESDPPGCALCFYSMSGLVVECQNAVCEKEAHPMCVAQQFGFDPKKGDHMEFVQRDSIVFSCPECLSIHNKAARARGKRCQLESSTFTAVSPDAEIQFPVVKRAKHSNGV